MKGSIPNPPQVKALPPELIREALESLQDDVNELRMVTSKVRSCGSCPGVANTGRKTVSFESPAAVEGQNCLPSVLKRGRQAHLKVC